MLGGITVLTDLNPWVVAFHLLFSMAIISLAVLYLWRDRPPVSPPPHVRPARRARLVDVRRRAGWCSPSAPSSPGRVPHAGDATAPRNGLDPLQLSQLHADVVFLLVGLTLGLVLALRGSGAPSAVTRAALVLVVVELGQGLIGFVQYFTDLPIVLVELPPARRRADRRDADLGAPRGPRRWHAAPAVRRDEVPHLSTALWWNVGRRPRQKESGRMPRSGAGLSVLVAGLLLLAGCGGSEPPPLKAMSPEVPADLCATIPEAAKAGLVSNSSTDDSGNPTAACSLRSPDGSSGQVHAVVTWMQVNDDVTADNVLGTQCRAIDKTEYKEQTGFQVNGADSTCAATSTVGGADAATIAAVKDREVVTVRLTSQPPGKTPALQQSVQMLEGVLSSVTG